MTYTLRAPYNVTFILICVTMKITISCCNTLPRWVSMTTVTLDRVDSDWSFLFLKTDQWGWISSLDPTREQSTGVRRRIHSTFFIFIFIYFFLLLLLLPPHVRFQFPNPNCCLGLIWLFDFSFLPFFVGKSFQRKISFAAEDSDSGSLRFPCVLNHVITSHGF